MRGTAGVGRRFGATRTRRLGSILWRAAAVGAMVAGPLVATASFAPPAGATTAGTAPVRVQFPTSPRTAARIPTHPTSTKTFDQATEVGATFTLETGTGPNPATLTPTTYTCTTGPTGTCMITDVAPGTLWAVETFTPIGDAPSMPVQVTRSTSATESATVILVPDDCTGTSTRYVGKCANVQPQFDYGPLDNARPDFPPPMGLLNLGFYTYSYNPVTHALALTAHTTATVITKTQFHLCFGPHNMTFGIMLPFPACERTDSYLKTMVGATPTTYSSAQTTSTTDTTTYDIKTVPNDVYWFADTGFGLGPIASSVPTATPPAATLSTQPSQSSITKGAAITDTATVTGTSFGGAPAGTVTFSVCGPTGSNEPCNPTTTDMVGTGAVALTAAASGAVSTATSASFTPTAVGRWCFSAVYTPAATSLYTTTSDNVNGTAVATECVTVGAVAFTSAPPTVPGATVVHTGMPWSGSGPFEAGAAALGAGMLVLGLDQRRQYRRRAGARS